MINVEEIKENLPNMLRFSPMAWILALALLVLGNVLILNPSFLVSDSFIGKVSVFLIMGFFLYIWVALHRHAVQVKGLLIAYVLATSVWLYLGYGLFYSEEMTEVIVFKSLFLTLAFVLAYVYVPFYKKRNSNVKVLMHIHHIKYAFFGSLRYIFLIALGLLVIGATSSFLLKLDISTLLQFIGFNMLSGIFIYGFMRMFMINPNKFDLDVKKYEAMQNRYFIGLLYGFTAIIFTVLNLFVIKILVTQVLPKGQVAWLVMGFSFFAFFSYLTFVPYKAKIKKYNTLLWGTLILQSLVLLGSIGVRVYEYGVTEKRYLLVAYGLWLFGISLYFLFKKEKAQIFWLFSTLSLVIFLSQVGPVNGYLVSKYSQQQRLVTLVEDYKNNNTLYAELDNVYYYLKSTHGIKSIEELYPSVKKKNFYSFPKFLASLGLASKTESITESYTSKYYYRSSSTVYNVEEYDYLLLQINCPYGHRSYDLDKDTNLEISVKEQKIVIEIEDDVLTFELKNFSKKLDLLNNRSNLSEEEMTLLQESQKYKVKMLFTNLSINHAQHNITDFSMDIYIKKNK